MVKSKSVLNLISNILSLVLSMGLSMWLVPFIINTLGTEAYGFIPLTQQFVSYMTVISVALTSMSGRFFTIARRNDNMLEAETYFNTSLTAASIGSILIGILILFFSLFINKIINVPLYLLWDVRLAFLIYGIVFLIGMLTSIFSDAPFANNKIYLTSIVNIINIIVKFLVIVLILKVLVPRIWYISLGNLIAGFISLIVSVYFFKKLEPDIKINYHLFDIDKLKEILSSSVWNSFGWIGTILFLQIDLLVANWNLGPKLAGEYSAVLQLSTLLRTFSGAITSVFTPTIVALYATKRIKELVKYSNDSVNMTGLLISLPIGLVCGLGGVFLSIWINPSFIKYQGLLSLLTIHLSVNLSVQSLFAVQTALNKVKIPAVATVVMGVINLGLALLLSGPVGMGAYGIALAGAIVLTSKNLVFTPLYVAYITKQARYAYLKGVIRPVIATLGVAAFGYLVQNNITINNWYSFFIVCSGISVIYVIVVYLFLIKKEEKVLFKKIGKSFIKR